ncbi:MerR family transcriptional regulator [Saccharothrix luteola]|uniref:MerR family transcriptional regulator n=1 Tax=Saccharothrix luteola TaxID=2893018 RepID=UPI001E4539BF|nr:MerR family transcriptional regulator [Saccharothrix luteola]MCC8248841.1 MerR family transcriptional regulator [Saccharothrix luteola]
MTGLRSGQLAEAAGVNHQTLRYYERRGLLSEPERTPGGHRVYPPEALTVLRMIKAAKRLGFTLEEISDLLVARRRLSSRREQGLGDRVAVKLAEVEARIADLEVIRDMLRSALDYGCDDLITCAHAPSCPVLLPEATDEASCGTC